MNVLRLLVVCNIVGIFISCANDSNLLTEEDLIKVDSNPQVMLTFTDNLHVENMTDQQKAMYYIIRSTALDRLYDKGYTVEKGVLQAKEYFKKCGNKEMLIESLYRLGNIHDSQSDPTQAINDYLDALTVAERDANTYWLFHLNSKIGIHYLMRYDEQEADHLLEKSMQYLKELDIDQLDIDAKLQVGKVLLYKKKYAKAQKIFSDISAAVADNDLYKSQALRYLSVIYCRQKDWDNAVHYGQQANLLSQPKDSYKNNLLLLYSYYHMGDSAKVSYYKELLNRDTIQNINIGQQYNFICAEIYQKKGHYEKALHHLRQSVMYEDSIIHVLSKATIDELILKHQNYNLNLTNKSQAIKKNIIVFLFWVIFVFILFVYYKQRKKQNRNRCQLEMQIETMENVQRREEKGRNLLKDIFLRDLEISKRIALLKSRQTEKNQFLFKELAKLFTINEMPSFELLWESFYKNFNIVFSDFHTRIITKYPHLCEKEVQLCCLTLVGFKTDEIAAVWNQSVFSVQKYRSNIRKKIGVPENGDIIAYLHENM